MAKSLEDLSKKNSEESMDDESEAPTGRIQRLMAWLRINPNLIMLKVTLFVMYGATASLLPYLTIHMQSIGLTVPEISFVYLALPFTTFLSPPITGFLVDRFGEYKPVVITALILNAAFHHSLLLIPHQETPGVMPSAYVMRHPDTRSVEDENDTVTDFVTRFGEKLLIDQGVNITALDKEDLRCGGLVMFHNMTKLSLQRLELISKDCMVQKCDFRKGGPDICPPDYKESDDKTFYIYFFMRFMGTIMLSAGVTIMDPIALTMIQKYGGDFGRERLFSSIGMAIFSPITGMLIDMRSKQVGITVTVGTLSSIPFLYGADAITARIGHVNVIIVAFFSHAARLVGYSFIE
ncbi:hypothetical protein MSG28_010768 [Choristoneura fumiferana]|uniref:Uncharacterized protein n=1 Tax=Choristoneura fumiferana TaxID=7141 RepID=A0ACC0KPD8_CHOFU|nr:hypothetical protein MSG28_010768 [Choristoneura fumiferana]